MMGTLEILDRVQKLAAKWRAASNHQASLIAADLETLQDDIEKSLDEQSERMAAEVEE